MPKEESYNLVMEVKREDTSKYLNPETLDEIVDRIKKSGDVEKIILFGSFARGDMDEYSDIDIVVIKETKERFVKRLLDIESFADLPIHVDVFVYTPEEFATMFEGGNPFIDKVIKEGKIIYEKQP